MSVTLPVQSEILQPLLETIGYWKGSKPIPSKSILLKLSDIFRLSEEERNLRTPRGNQTIFGHRVNMAKNHLKKAGLIISPKHGYYGITSRGMFALNQVHVIHTLNDLRRYPEYEEYFLEKKQNNSLTKEEKERKKEINFYRKILDYYHECLLTPDEFIRRLQKIVDDYDFTQGRLDNTDPNKDILDFNLPF
jgi:restriction system protein